MDRRQIIEHSSHILVGAAATWVLRQMGMKQGALATAALVILAHAYLNAPVARLIDESI